MLSDLKKKNKKKFKHLYVDKCKYTKTVQLFLVKFNWNTIQYYFKQTLIIICEAYRIVVTFHIKLVFADFAMFAIKPNKQLKKSVIENAPQR